MNDIVILSGIFNSFLENEIDYVKKWHNIAAILISCDDTKERVGKILQKHGISPEVVFTYKKRYWNVFKLIRWLFRKEVRSEIITKCFTGEKKLKRLAYVVLYGMYAMSLEKTIKKIPFHSNNICLYSYWMSVTAYALAYLKTKEKYSGFKMICRAHGFDLYKERSSMNYIPFRSFINEQLDLISFISGNGRSYFEREFPEPHNKQVSYLGTKNPFHILKQIGAKSEICIASCSSIIQLKRLDLIISVMAGLDGIPIRWIHLGSGELMGEMKSLASSKLAGTSVVYEFIGQVSNSEILGIYQNNDVDFFINLSDTEGLPVSIMEAMSMGIPVIARTVGGIAEIVCKDSGLLLDGRWDDRNYQTIRDFVKCRIDDMAKYQGLSKASFEIWKSKFNAEKNYSEFFANL